MPIVETQLTDAVQRLREGGVVVFPTETAYGLAADATNASAVERVHQMKERPLEKTVGLIVADLKMAEKYADLSDRLRTLSRTYWPGALTIVAPAKTDTDLAVNVVRSDGTIALRVSSHETAAALTKKLGKPITATSANRTGQPTCYDVACVKQQLAGRAYQPDLYLNAGALAQRPPSTIVTVADGEWQILRKGALQIDETDIV